VTSFEYGICKSNEFLNMPDKKVPDPRKNRLLAALPGDAWQRWEPLLEHVEMPLGHVLYESGKTLSHMYFPTTAIVSLLYVMENGASAEIAVVSAVNDLSGF
jgi:hypothetical protein